MSSDDITVTRDGAVATHHPDTGEHLYDIAADLFAVDLPVVAAVQGAAIGGGLGLALVADERVTTPASRWVANFTRLGFHPGFGLTASLPWTVGTRTGAVLLATSREITGTRAFELGLADEVIDEDRLLDAAGARAREWAALAPLAVRSVRATTRAPLLAGVRAALARERAEQERLMATGDWREGIRAAAERRTPRFDGR